MGTEKSSWQVCPVTIEAKIVGRRLLGFDLLLVVDTIRELGDMHHHFYWFAWLQRDIWLKIIMCGLPRGNGWVVTHSVNWKIKYQNTQCLTMFRRHTKKNYCGSIMDGCCHIPKRAWPTQGFDSLDGTNTSMFSRASNSCLTQLGFRLNVVPFIMRAVINTDELRSGD